MQQIYNNPSYVYKIIQKPNWVHSMLRVLNTNSKITDTEISTQGNTHIQTKCNGRNQDLHNLQSISTHIRYGLDSGLPIQLG